MNKYGDIDMNGNYTSSIKDEGVRFGVTLSALLYIRNVFTVTAILVTNGLFQSPHTFDRKGNTNGK